MAYGEPVHPVMQFDPADPGYLYLMTSHQVSPTRGAPGHGTSPLQGGLTSLGPPTPASVRPASPQGEAGSLPELASASRWPESRWRPATSMSPAQPAWVRPTPTAAGAPWRPGERAGRAPPGEGHLPGGIGDLTLQCHPRCTLQQDCANATQPHFWTSTSEGPGRCPAMTVLPAEIDVRREYPVSPHVTLQPGDTDGERPWAPQPLPETGRPCPGCPRDLEAHHGEVTGTRLRPNDSLKVIECRGPGA